MTITAVYKLEYCAELRNYLKRIGKKQDTDARIEKVKRDWTTNSNPHLLVEVDILFTRGSDVENCKLIVPSGMARSMTRKMHEIYGHPGKYKTYHMFKNNSYVYSQKCTEL